MKLWRDAVNDYDLIALARKANAAATTALLDKMTRPGLSSDPSYRANSRTVETYVTNNVEDLLRATAAGRGHRGGAEAAHDAGRLQPALRAGRLPPTPSSASTERLSADWNRC